MNLSIVASKTQQRKSFKDTTLKPHIHRPTENIIQQIAQSDPIGSAPSAPLFLGQSGDINFGTESREC